MCRASPLIFSATIIGISQMLQIGEVSPARLFALSLVMEHPIELLNSILACRVIHRRRFRLPLHQAMIIASLDERELGSCQVCHLPNA